LNFPGCVAVFADAMMIRRIALRHKHLKLLKKNGLFSELAICFKLAASTMKTILKLFRLLQVVAASLVGIPFHNAPAHIHGRGVCEVYMI
jgi:hypothetical protein